MKRKGLQTEKETFMSSLRALAFPIVMPALLLPLILLSGCKDEPQPVPPTVETVSAVTEISTTTAVAGGEVVLDGETPITARGVCWGTSPEPTTAGERTLDGRGVGKFTSLLSGLAPATTYYLRAYAINNAGTGYGNEITFTTLGGEASITTAAVSLITPTSARCGGNVTGDGGAEIAERGICWGTQQSPTADMNKATSGKGTGEFTAKMSGLTPATAYYVRAYAINVMGTVYGNEVTFTTLGGESNITTAAAADITATTALSGGSVGDEGGSAVIAKGVCWGTAPNPTIEGGKTTDGSGAGEFESRITGLTPATTYYLRAYATNALGTQYGNEITFTTMSGTVKITTVKADNIGATSARSGGNITDDGGTAITVKGVCWSKSKNPTIADSKTINGPGTGEFLNDLTGLTLTTEYYVRAYATNELGDTYYGNEAAFTTIDPFMHLTPGTLQSVVEENGLEDITSLTLGGTIDQRDFAYMKNMVDNHSLKDIDLSGVTVAAYKDYPANEIPAYAFEESNKLISFIFPAKITSIGDYAFKKCMGLTGSLAIPDGVTSIGQRAFSFCTGFNGSLTIPEGVTTIGEYAFFYCLGLTGSLTIPNSVMSIENNAFWYCSGFNGSLTIGNSVESIGDSAFESCKGFTGSLTIPDSVVSIGNSAFSHCEGFTGTLTIGSSVVSIGNNAFTYCSNLTGSLVIPDSVTSIGNYAFYSCSGLTGSLVIPDGVTTMGNSAFSYCKGFTGSLTIGSGVAAIESNTFSYCTGFTGSLTIGDNVTSIGSYAFCGCSGFTGSLTIPDGVTAIEYDVFSGCSGFTGSLVIPGNVTTIGSSAFSDCSGFNGTLTIPDGVSSIEYNAFSGCSGFTGSLVIPDSVTSMGSSVFFGCSGFDGSLTISSNITWIGLSMFYGCNGFTGSLIIPENATYIGSSAFYGCSGFTGSLEIPGSVTSIGANAFYGCNGFTDTLNIPENVASIGKSAFFNCDALSDVNVAWATPITYSESMLPSGKTVYVPAASISLYEEADGWKNHPIVGY